MAIRLTFIDSDSKFTEKLATWISKYMPYQFSIEILTGRESLESWVRGGRKSDLVAVSADLFTDVRDLLPTTGILILDEGSHIEIEGDLPRVPKYRPAEGLVRDFLSLCADRMPKMHNSERYDQKLTLVACIDGSDAACAVAPAIARLMALKGRRVLYLSLENNQLTDLFFRGNNSRGLNEMMYYVKSNRDNLPMRLETCVSKDIDSGVDFLKSPPGLLQPGSMNNEEIGLLLSSVGESRAYSEIVLSADPVMDDKLLNMIKKSDRLVFSLSDTAGSRLRMKKIADELGKHEVGIDMSGRILLAMTGYSEYRAPVSQFPGMNAIHIFPRATGTGAEAGLNPDESDLAALDNALGGMDGAGEKA